MKPTNQPNRLLLWTGYFMVHLILVSGMLLFGYHIGETFAINHADTFLQVAAMSPGLEKGRVSSDPILRIRFTERLSQNTINEENILLLENECRLNVHITYDETRRTISVIPQQKLSAKAAYRLIIHPEMISVEQHRMLETLSVPFSIVE